MLVKLSEGSSLFYVLTAFATIKYDFIHSLNTQTNIGIFTGLVHLRCVRYPKGIQVVMQTWRYYD